MAKSRLSFTACCLHSSRYSLVYRLRHAPAGTHFVTWVEALNLWTDQNLEFHRSFIGTLASCNFADFFRECCPVSHETVNEPFEFVLTDAQGRLLRAKASSAAFAQHLTGSRRKPMRELAVAFPNLEHDAMLVAPSQVHGCSKNMYGNLASFSRGAAEEQQLELWRLVGEQASQFLHRSPAAAKTLWLNTDGSGVPWLHVRLDTTPKYIKHAAYRAAPVQGQGQHTRKVPRSANHYMQREDDGCQDMDVDNPMVVARGAVENKEALPLPPGRHGGSTERLRRQSIDQTESLHRHGDAHSADPQLSDIQAAIHSRKDKALASDRTTAPAAKLQEPQTTKEKPSSSNLDKAVGSKEAAHVSVTLQCYRVFEITKTDVLRPEFNDVELSMKETGQRLNMEGPAVKEGLKDGDIVSVVVKRRG